MSLPLIHIYNLRAPKIFFVSRQSKVAQLCFVNITINVKVNTKSYLLVVVVATITTFLASSFLSFVIIAYARFVSCFFCCTVNLH